MNLWLKQLGLCWAVVSWVLKSNENEWKRFTRQNFKKKLPKNASMMFPIPFTAFKKLSGKLIKQLCWCWGSTESSLKMVKLKNCGVWLITCAKHKALGGPIIFRNRYQDWAIQSSVASAGTNWASSSCIVSSGNVDPYVNFSKRAVSE